MVADMDMETATLPKIADIEAAAARLRGRAVPTPLLESPLLNDRLDGRLLIKPECLQRTGSFKYRGAFNRLAALDDAVRRHGVVAYSSGNHAQGVAAAARDWGVAATIVMPADAPAIKRRNTEAWGARVEPYDRNHEDREAIAVRIAAETGASLVKPYDDPFIIAGQGTVGLEIAQQAAALGVRPDAVLVPCGGGGLVAGTALALADRLPGCLVHAVEPAGFDDTARSLAAGTRLGNAPGATSLCDALLAPSPGYLTFALNRTHLAGACTVDDRDVLAAMAAAFEAFKLVIEPGGAIALAAVLTDHLPLAGRTVVAVLSGGNVDPGVFARCLAAG